MWVILLEIFVAVTLAFIIIWWTVPRKKDERKNEKKND
jgi:phage shock protein PspC (stress-responsive transcriptional regulator)